jgi:hypothetical protein
MALTGKHRSEEPLNILLFCFLSFVDVKLFFNWLEQSMARGIYIIIYSAADFIINQHLIIYRIQLQYTLQNI